MAETLPGTPGSELDILTDEQAAERFGATPLGAPSFDPNSVNPTFAHRQIQPPTTVYIDRNVRFFVRIETSLDTVVVDISAFILRAAGEMEEFTFSVTGRNDQDVAEEICESFGGYLMGITATTRTAGAYYGTTFVTIGLARGGLGSFIVPRILVANYVSLLQFVGWPEWPVRNSVDGTGRVRFFTGTDPGLDTEITEAVPANRRWKLLSFYAALVTDANVAGRNAQLIIDDGTNILINLPSLSTQAASLTRIYTWGIGLGTTDVVNTRYVRALPSALILQSGYRIRTATASKQAGDNWSAPNLQIEEWLERD